MQRRCRCQESSLVAALRAHTATCSSRARHCRLHSFIALTLYPPPPTPQVQTGAGRTGKWWGHQHWLPTAPASSSPSSTTGTAAASGTTADACPDLLVFAKGIASGYPLAGVAVRSSLVPADKMPPGTLVSAGYNV